MDRLMCRSLEPDVRVTMNMDDDIAARLQAEARRSGRPFEAVVNEYLRAGLAQRPAVLAQEPFRIAVLDLGGPVPGRSYDNIGELLHVVEGTGSSSEGSSQRETIPSA